MIHSQKLLFITDYHHYGKLNNDRRILNTVNWMENVSVTIAKNYDHVSFFDYNIEHAKKRIDFRSIAHRKKNKKTILNRNGANVISLKINA